jgi:hypothetical protein
MSYSPEFDRLAAEARMLLAREEALRDALDAAGLAAAPRAAMAIALLTARTRLVRIATGVAERRSGAAEGQADAAEDALPDPPTSVGPLAELAGAAADLERRYRAARAG